MKQNKGFTLIELLAVIVILAIIALIATPIILNVINDAREKSAVDAGYGYISAVENYIAMADLQASETGNPATLPNSETCTVGGSSNSTACANLLGGVKIKGRAPESGSTIVFDASGNIDSADMTFSGVSKHVKYNGSTAELS